VRAPEFMHLKVTPKLPDRQLPDQLLPGIYLGAEILNLTLYI